MHVRLDRHRDREVVLHVPLEVPDTAGGVVDEPKPVGLIGDDAVRLKFLEAGDVMVRRAAR